MTMRKKHNKDDRSSGDTLRFFPQIDDKYVCLLLLHNKCNEGKYVFDLAV